MNIELKISKKPVNYQKALKLLEKKVNSVKKGGKEFVWFLEHPITYTAGIRSKKHEILNKSIRVIKTNRGGKITLHNPGQQVVYFAINLNKRKKDIRNLIRQIENTIIEFLKIYKIHSYADQKNIGVWVKNPAKINIDGTHDKKIAALGLRVKKWVTFHGLSLNVNPNLDFFNNINPCGISAKGVTSLQELGIEIEMAEIDELFKKNFSKIFTK